MEAVLHRLFRDRANPACNMEQLIVRKLACHDPSSTDHRPMLCISIAKGRSSCKYFVFVFKNSFEEFAERIANVRYGVVDRSFAILELAPPCHHDFLNHPAEQGCNDILAVFGTNEGPKLGPRGGCS